MHDARDRGMRSTAARAASAAAEGGEPPSKRAPAAGGTRRRWRPPALGEPLVFLPDRRARHGLPLRPNGGAARWTRARACGARGRRTARVRQRGLASQEEKHGGTVPLNAARGREAGRSHMPASRWSRTRRPERQNLGRARSSWAALIPRTRRLEDRQTGGGTSELADGAPRRPRVRRYGAQVDVWADAAAQNRACRCAAAAITRITRKSRRPPPSGRLHGRRD